MSVNYNFQNISGDKCTNMNGLSSTYCLPVKIQCVETDDDGFLQNCSKTYCDIKCEHEPESVIPYIEGAKIMFQLQFRDKVNTDIKNPTLGWFDWVFFEIFDWNGVSQGSADYLANRYYVCHNGKNSYQVIEFNLSIFGLLGEIACKNFYIEFFAMDGVGEEATIIDSRCSHRFALADDCMETHLVQGLYTKFDCLGNFYGTPDCGPGQTNSTFFKYENTTRIEAKIVKKAPTSTEDDDKIVITDNYKLTTAHATHRDHVFMSYYLISWYANILKAKNIKIDNISKQISNFALNTEDEQENCAVVNFEWSEECKNCYG